MILALLSAQLGYATVQLWLMVDVGLAQQPMVAP